MQSLQAVFVFAIVAIFSLATATYKDPPKEQKTDYKVQDHYNSYPPKTYQPPPRQCYGGNSYCK